MKDLNDKKSLKGYKNLWRYMKYFKRYIWLCVGFWVSLLLTGVIGFFTPLLLGKMINAMTIASELDNAITYALYILILELAGKVVYMLRVPLFKNLENKVKRDVKLDILKSSYNINIGEFEKLGNGAFITRLTSDLDSLANSFKRISETIVDFMSRIGFIIYVFIASYWIGLFILGFIIIRYLVYQIRIHYYAKMKPEVLSRWEYINSLVGESVRGIKDIKTLGLSDNLIGRVNTLQNNFMKYDNKEWYVGTTLYTFADIVKLLCDFSFIVLCVFMIKNGRLDLAVFYSVYIYKNQVMEFAVRLGNLQDYFKEIEVNAFRVFQLASPEAYKHDEFGEIEINDFKGNIEFKNVSFHYVEGEPILDDVSFVIQPNTHVAFVGESGCGKSTIVALICKLYDPTGGVILFDGVNSVSLAQSFGRHVAMVNQSPYLFNLTIKENLQLVKPNVTDDEIYDALKLANAYDFVKEFPDGLDSYLGEGGTKLSGGQKQRICIARALIKNSKIIIFDEATSALDNISQEYVMNSVEELKKNKTVITIAHRLSTIENCDVIYFINKGKIQDFGTHEYLLENNEKYASLYKKQKREAEEKNGEN